MNSKHRRLQAVLTSILAILSCGSHSAFAGSVKVEETYKLRDRGFTQKWELAETSGAQFSLHHIKNGEKSEIAVTPVAGNTLQERIMKLSIRKKSQPPVATLSCESYFVIESEFGSNKFCHSDKKQSDELAALVHSLWDISPNRGQFLRHQDRR